MRYRLRQSPAWVDRNNSGSHQDMDFFTFVDSSSARSPGFGIFSASAGEHGDETGDRLFERLRFAGQNAEAKMFSATGGVNTHKGLIFASAILCGALGKVYKDAFLLGKKPPVPLDAVVGECKKLGSCSLKDFKAEDRRQDVSAGPVADDPQKKRLGKGSTQPTALPEPAERLPWAFRRPLPSAFRP